MQVLRDDQNGMQRALEVLRGGGVVAHATETCYGFACDLRNLEAVKKLFVMKQRPPNQPVSALFASIEEAKRFVEWNDDVQKLADRYLPGPLTIILSARQKPPTTLLITPTSKRGNEFTIQRSIGLRVSSHPTAQQLVNRFGSPLSTTSANLHGQPNPYSPHDIIEQFGEKDVRPDLILDSGTLPPTPPSTVLDLTGTKSAKRRQGSLQL